MDKTLDPELVALAADGVTMTTAIEDTQVVYKVIVGGDIHNGDISGCRGAWHKTVVFGRTDRTVAGGYDFREAAREQEEVAWAYVHAARSLP